MACHVLFTLLTQTNSLGDRSACWRISPKRSSLSSTIDLLFRDQNLMLSVVILHFHKRVIIFTEAAPNTPARMTDGGARTGTGRVRQAARDHPSPANRDFVAYGLLTKNTQD